MSKKQPSKIKNVILACFHIQESDVFLTLSKNNVNRALFNLVLWQKGENGTWQIINSRHLHRNQVFFKETLPTKGKTAPLDTEGVINYAFHLLDNTHITEKNYLFKALEHHDRGKEGLIPFKIPKKPNMPYIESKLVFDGFFNIAITSPLALFFNEML